MDVKLTVKLNEVSIANAKPTSLISQISQLNRKMESFSEEKQTVINNLVKDLEKL